jgi:exonuclease SbcC
MSIDYEKEYNSLKEEFEQSKIDNDEICKEYESTIDIMTEANKKLEENISKLEKEKKLLEDNISKLEKEKENLISKNKDKISDIQDLNKQIEKLKTENKKIKEEKNITKEKIITLENDNDHYQNQIRQNEALIEDLNNQYESVLEENITLQTEFESYKQQTEECLIRKDEEIKDYKNDIVNKEKIIQRLNDKKNMRELKQKLMIPSDIIDQYQRKLTSTMYQGNMKNNLEKIKSNDISKEQINNSVAYFDQLVTPMNDTNTKYPSKFMEIYRKSLREDKNMNDINNIDLNKNVNIDKELTLKQKSSDKEIDDNDNPLLKIKTLKDSVIIGDFGDIDNIEKNNKEENEDEEDSTVSDKKCFEDLVICDERDFNIIPIKKLMNESQKNKDKKIADYLRNMLIRIQKRKEILSKNLKMNNMRLEKLGFIN